MPRDPSTTHGSGRPPRRARRIHEEDPGKLAEIARCPSCQASYRNGRWTWESAPADAYGLTCPACERIQSDHPAGLLRAEGEFAWEHRDELVAMIRHVAESESAEHPLNRIMAVQEQDRGLVVTTTDGRLVMSLGRALVSAYDGRLEHPPTRAEQDDLLRVRWAR